MNYSEVVSLSASELPRHVIVSGAELNNKIWPNPLHSIDDRIARTIANGQAPADAVNSRHMWHYICAGETVVSMARTFRRVIASEATGRFGILALASVSTDPAHRREGLASKVVQAAFSRLDAELKVCFFQTGVPAFYEQLGANLIKNPIFDSSGAPRTFWEPYAMIYQRAEIWPTGPIDLLGEGW